MLSQRGLRAAGRVIRATRPTGTTARVARRWESSSIRDQAQNLEGTADNAFNRERLAVKHHAEATADFWRKLSLYVVIPALIIGATNTWVQWEIHWDHQSHEPPIDKRPQYSYMNIRTKAFPWGNGDKTLFWNDHYNYKPPEGEA